MITMQELLLYFSTSQEK